ncbi:MAG: hypothetical protein PHE32_01000 [Candidatus Shapirobacteria bacterium]|nr:hypothetical protein [Candidatus Shapirobacteria bacterium]MDD4410270.1 hypothetical protein [Candidatus Shapirobacteria bacterium]
MKIYFIASSRLVGASPKLYSKMYAYLSTQGKMVSDKVMKWIKTGIKDISGAPLKFTKENYIQSLDAVKKADIVVMETSGHSMSMGYLIGKALEMNKPVIALHDIEHIPAFIQGINDPKLIISEYKEGDVEEIMEKALKKANSLIDVRFNFFVSSKILNYLDWVSQKKMLPRSVFLRDLIEKEIKKDKEFKM